LKLDSNFLFFLEIFKMLKNKDSFNQSNYSGENEPFELEDENEVDYVNKVGISKKIQLFFNFFSLIALSLLIYGCSYILEKNCTKTSIVLIVICSL
jgi:hypothetical protein